MNIIKNVRKKVKKSLNILSYKRPAGSKTEEEAIKRFIDVLPNVQVDAFGNRIVRVGTENTTMFSCHTDTVHHTEGMQQPLYDPHKGEIFVSHDECLGADDGAGIVIMIALIKAGINGLYVFHREEEIGGNGSDYIQKNTPELVDGIERCIAFDRRGTESIITHQGYERCCSDKFCEDFAQELMKSGKWFFPDNTGSFTDSANYTHLIPECTNLSCGYDGEHTSAETLDVAFVQELINALIEVNFDNLITDRDPSVDDYDFNFNDYGYGSYMPANDTKEYQYADITKMSNADISDMVYYDPDDAIELIREYRNFLITDRREAM